jgi:WD40 repeat protein
MSLRLSSDGGSALMNLANGEIALWDRNLEIVEPTKTVFVPEVRDRELGKVVTRSCFGGAREQFVACGGVDGRVHVWRRDTGTLLTRLECHGTTVNAVCWNPCDPFMMATASDDFTVKLWTAPTADAAR